MAWAIPGNGTFARITSRTPGYPLRGHIEKTFLSWVAEQKSLRSPPWSFTNPMWSVPLFVYMDQLFCHCVFIYSCVHWQLITFLHDGFVLFLFVLFLRHVKQYINHSLSWTHEDTGKTIATRHLTHGRKRSTVLQLARANVGYHALTFHDENHSKHS